MALTSTAWAYDFSAVAPSGQTLYYSISTSTTVSLTCPNYSADEYYYNYTRPTGDLTIPSTVTYNGTTYSVTTIGNSALSNCSGLTSVTIPNSVTSIGSYAFSGCIGLTSVTIPNSVTSIEGGSFRYCSGLTSVTIGNSVTTIGDFAFQECSGLTSVTIGNSVTSIGSNTFQNCIGLTSVTIPNSVTSIGNYAFGNCAGLTSVAIPNSVTSIGNYAFYNCTGLTSVTIPNSVTSIGTHAFYECISLMSVYLNSVPLILSETFTTINHANATLYLSCGLMDSIRGTGWMSFFNKIETCPHTISTLADSSMGTVSGSGTYSYDTTITLIATPNDNYHFVRWSDGSTENPRTIRTTMDMSLTVVFEGDARVLTVNNAFGGGTYPYGTNVTLMALPQPNGQFTGWSDGNTSNPRLFTVLTDTVIEALYGPMGGGQPITHDTITIFNYVYDTVINILHDTVMVTQYIYDTLIINTMVYDTTVVNNTIYDTTSFTHYFYDTVTENNTVYATLYDTTSFTHYIYDTTTLNNTIYSTVYDTTVLTHYVYDTTTVNNTIYTTIYDTTVVNNTIYDTTEFNHYFYDTTTVNTTIYDTTVYIHYYYDTTVVFDTTSITHYVFDTIVLDPVHYTLSVSSANITQGLVAGNGVFPEGTVVEIAAIPIEGHRFVSWHDGNTDNPRQVTLTGDMSFTASFGTVGTDAVMPYNFHVYAVHDVIVVENADGNRVRIFDAVGRQMTTQSSVTDTYRYQVPASGVYLIQVGEHPARKVTIVK